MRNLPVLGSKDLIKLNLMVDDMSNRFLNLFLILENPVLTIIIMMITQKTLTISYIGESEKCVINPPPPPVVCSGAFFCYFVNAYAFKI